MRAGLVLRPGCIKMSVASTVPPGFIPSGRGLWGPARPSGAAAGPEEGGRSRSLREEAVQQNYEDKHFV